MNGLVPTLALAVLLGACSKDPEQIRAQRSKPLVCATIQPVGFYVTRLAGDAVDCEVVLPRGAHPQHWVPGREVLGHLAGADLVLFHGATLEGWRRKVSLPLSRQSSVSAALRSEYLTVPGGITHTHGGKSHTHDGVDPFLWLDLSLASRQAKIVHDLLARLLEDPARLAPNLESLQGALAQELAAWKKLEVPGGAICASQRLYDYWARSMGLEIVQLDLYEDSDAAAVGKAREALQAKRPPLVLCPAPPGPGLSKVLGELGLQPVVFDPCFTSAGDDFLQVMAANRARLQRALEQRSK